MFSNGGGELFRFNVSRTMSAGDIVRARTPDGILVDITIPDRAGAGDVVQFAVPRVTEAKPSEVVDTSVIPAKLKGEERLNVADIDEHGVSNTVRRLTYAMTMPAGVKAGQRLVAALPDGERVSVTVPDGAGLGRELFFRVPSTMSTDKLVQVFMKGFLRKKSPKGLVGLHPWQLRWFELTQTGLAYWEICMDGALEQRGHIAIDELVGIRVHRNDNERLDLKLKSGRLFQLCAPYETEREDWAESLQEALLNAAENVPKQLTGSAQVDPQFGEAGEYGEGSTSAEPELAVDDRLHRLSASAADKHRTLVAKFASLVSGMDRAVPRSEVQATAVTADVYMARLLRAREANHARRQPQVAAGVR